MIDKKITDEMWVEAYEDMQIRKKMVQMQCETCWTESAELGLRALEKQIPKSVVLEGDGYADGFLVYEVICPECDALLDDEYDADLKHDPFCPYCGQRLNWDLNIQED